MGSCTTRRWIRLLRRSWWLSLRLLLKQNPATDCPASGHGEISMSLECFNIELNGELKDISCFRLLPDTCHGEGEERYHMWRSGSGPLGSFRNVPVSSTWLSDSGTKPFKRKNTQEFQGTVVYAEVRGYYPNNINTR